MNINTVDMMQVKIAIINVFLNHVTYCTTESGSNKMVPKFLSDHVSGKKCEISIPLYPLKAVTTSQII